MDILFFSQLSPVAKKHEIISLEKSISNHVQELPK